MLAGNVDLHYEKNPALKEEVLKLKEWAETQPYLPRISEQKLIMFLNSCYFKMDAAKSCIKNYYEMRAKWPEFFAKRDPRTPALKLQLQVLNHALLPKTTPEGYHICFTKLMDTNATNFIYTEQMKIFDMCASFWITQICTSEGQVCILDMTGFNFWHLSKLGFGTVRNFLSYIQDALPVRVKGIHFINSSVFIEKVVDLMKRFVKSELFDIIHVHHVMSTFYEFIPMEVLPEEYGGENGCLKELQERHLRDILESAEFFVEEERNDRGMLTV